VISVYRPRAIDTPRITAESRITITGLDKDNEVTDKCLGTRTRKPLLFVQLSHLVDLLAESVCPLALHKKNPKDTEYSLARLR
jgi:hypothetical protein